MPRGRRPRPAARREDRCASIHLRKGPVCYTRVPRRESAVRLTADGRWLFAGRALRTFSFGYLSLALALYLAARGFSAAAIGGVLTATMAEDALFTVLVSGLVNRLGRRRVLTACSLLITFAGVMLAEGERAWVLVVGAVLGTLSPSGQEAGPFSPLEQSLLPETVSRDARTRAFAWYNVAGFLPAALGALAGAAWLRAASAIGLEERAAYRALLWFYALNGGLLALIYRQLSPAAGMPPRRPDAPRAGLHRSRRVVLEMAGLQALDSLAGGFIVQSLLVYWFHLRYGARPDVLGPLFFGTNLLSAASFLVAARVADRVGLLNTMVFSHLPSNVLLCLVPLAPNLGGAAALLLARHLLSQMDVPTRQAYTIALVAPDERPAAAGYTTSARALAQAVAPVMSGLALSQAAGGLPFFLAGGLKIAYDLVLYFRFRSVRLPEDGR
ncbi:MAG: MFS transporter [Acidobacteria bacterium]|nr:MAG: MFS transporter [Acidobacteriota bacterium]